MPQLECTIMAQCSIKNHVDNNDLTDLHTDRIKLKILLNRHHFHFLYKYRYFFFTISIIKYLINNHGHIFKKKGVFEFKKYM